MSEQPSRPVQPVQPAASVTPASTNTSEAPATPKQDFWSYFWIAYLVIALGFTLYSNYHGETQARGFFFNLGRGLVWPFTVFPVLGKIVGGILAVVFVIWIMSSSNSKSND